jgi:hypothetical protein
MVTAIDEEAGTIEIQSFDGDLDELDRETWWASPLELAEEPENWTGPVEVEPDDLDNAETVMTAADWSEPLQPLKDEKEAWEDATPDDERDPLGEGVSAEEPIVDEPTSRQKLR